MVGGEEEGRDEAWGGGWKDESRAGWAEWGKGCNDMLYRAAFCERMERAHTSIEVSSNPLRSCCRLLFKHDCVHWHGLSVCVCFGFE